MSVYEESWKERAAIQQKEIESIKPRHFVLELSDADVERLYEKAYSSSATPEQVLKDFVGNLVCGTYTSGSDEVETANAYFGRTYWALEGDFLAWAMEEYQLDDVKEAMEIRDDASENLEYYAEHPESADPDDIEGAEEQHKAAESELREIYEIYVREMEQHKSGVIQNYEEAINSVGKYLRELKCMKHIGYTSWPEYFADQRKDIPPEDKAFKELKEWLDLDAHRVNYCADDKDINRNHVNYGCVITTARVLREMGHRTDIPVWEDENGCLRIPYIIIDDEKISYTGTMADEEADTAAEDKAGFIQAIGKALHRKAPRTGVTGIEYVSDGTEEFAVITFDNGSQKRVCVTADSCLAMLNDVYRALE